MKITEDMIPLLEERLKEFDYDRKTGKFYHKKTRKITPGYLGKEVGSLRRDRMGRKEIYISLSLGNKKCGINRAHLVWFIETGTLPMLPMEIDHKDHNSLNDVYSNLRLVTKSDNQGNRRKIKIMTSKHKGVHKDSWKEKKGSRKFWRSDIGDGDKYSHKIVGHFSNEDDAAIAYDICAANRWELPSLNILPISLAKELAKKHLIDQDKLYNNNYPRFITDSVEINY